MPMRNTLLGVLAFFAAFLAVNRMVVARVPLPAALGLRTKTKFLVEHLEDYDAIWIGSSATLYGLRPEVFNAELERLGHPGFRIYNLGIGGMGSFETVPVLRRVLEAKPKRMKWVFYEEPVFDSLLWSPNIVIQRYIHWHDTDTTLNAIDALQYATKPPSEEKRKLYEDFLLAGGDGEWRRGAAWEHVQLGLRRELAVGQGPRLYDYYCGGPDTAWPSAQEISAGDGWMDIGLDPEPGAKRGHVTFRSHPEVWKNKVAHMVRLEAARPDPMKSYDLDSLRSLIKEIRSAGLEPIMYTPQRGLPSSMMLSLADRGELPALFPFHLTQEYPELVDMELHYDDAHLTAEGATLWSRRFAERFGRYLRERGVEARRTGD